MSGIVLTDAAGAVQPSPPPIFWSVLVAARNAEEFIGQCLESVKSQSFPSWECLVLDDHSDDETMEAAKRAAGSDERFRFFRTEERRSALPNLMDMISWARGDYVAILDGDDWFKHENVLGHLYRVYEENPRVMATSGSYERWPDGGRGHCRALAKDEIWCQAWPYGHTLTWRRELSLRSFEREPEAYIDTATGQPYASTYDLALFYPIVYAIEDADGVVAHVNEINYVYRRYGGNDDAIDQRTQLECAHKISLYWLNRLWKRDIDDLCSGKKKVSEGK